MDRFFVDPGALREGMIHVGGQTLNHLKNVLRYRPGEKVLVLDGTGREYHCVLEEYLPGEALLSVNSVQELSHELPAEISLFQALPKADKMDLIIQKAVELGAHAVVPVETARCVVRLDEKKAAKKRERWQAISESAAGQCGRGLIPEVAPVASFAEALAQLSGMDVALIPYEKAEGMGETRRLLASIQPGMRVGILIGPEGGFEAEEVERAKERGIHPISLGKRILRTETAGMALLAHLMMSLDGAGGTEKLETEKPEGQKKGEEGIDETDLL